MGLSFGAHWQDEGADKAEALKHSRALKCSSAGRSSVRNRISTTSVTNERANTISINLPSSPNFPPLYDHGSWGQRRACVWIRLFVKMSRE